MASHSLRATALQAAENKDLHSLRSLAIYIAHLSLSSGCSFGQSPAIPPNLQKYIHLKSDIFCWVMAMLVIFFHCDLIQSVFLLTPIAFDGPLLTLWQLSAR